MYRQCGGVGTGLKLAPPYACLGVGKFEENVFNNPNNEFRDSILLWKRFIDDVLMLFKGTKEECRQFVEWLNSLLPGVIKFKYEYSSKKIEFLDLELSIENGTLETNLYVKPTNAQLFLDYNSNHPQPCKEGIVHGEALRVIERCSKQEDEQTHLTNLKQKFLDRNYPEKLVDEKFEVAKQNNRKSLIHQNRRKRNDENKVRLIFTHSEANPPIHMWMRQCKQLLTKNEKAKQIGDKIQIGLKQPKNVQSIARNHNKPEEIGPPKNR